MGAVSVLSLAPCPPGDDDRCAGRLYHRGADGAEQRPGEFTVTTTTDENQLGGFGLLDEVVRGPVECDHTAHTNIGVTFLPAGQAFAKGLMCFRLDVGLLQLVNAEGIAVVCCVQGHQLDPPPRGFVEGDRGGQFRRRRSINA